MGGGILDFILGAAVIALPQHQIPVLLGTASIALFRKIKRKRSGHKKLGPDPGHASTVTTGGSTRQQVNLQFTDVRCSITNKKGLKKTILNDITGTAKPGRLLAIMGPSGGGKTSLLNALAGQVPSTKGMELQGNVTVNGAPRCESDHKQGYVQQEDLFYSQLNVRETLNMAAALRLPKDMSAEEKEAAVVDLIQRLGLTQSADTPVGDAKKRGLSGGEKKRLSIGCELLGSPMLLFLDEPTTGLDSFQAEKVMQTLKDLAMDGKTVVCSIHQPRSSIFSMFDDLLLLSEGSIIYSGPAKGVISHFESLGHPIPANYNPAEFIADLISINSSSSTAEKESRERVEKLRAAFKNVATSDESTPSSVSLPAASDSAAPEDETPCSWPEQVKLLFKRSWRQISRDKATNVARAMSNVSSAIIFGGIFWRMGRSQTSIQDRMGLMQVGAINAAMSSLIKTLNVFPKERVLVQRERAKGSYATAPYFAAKLAAESPIGALFPLLFAAIVYPATGLHPKMSRFAKFCGILTLESFTATSLGLAVGSFAPSTDAALAIGPGIMVLFIVFGGYYVNAGNVPRALRWIPSVSLIKHAFEGLCDNEFPGLDFEPVSADGAGDILKGEQVLQRLGFSDSSVAKTARAQARVLAFNYWLTYCILKAKKPAFQRMEPVPGRTM
ncbi:Protein white [Coccomyxa sp. Obi]|nr:Protein white [Coccomyxa sp. Obi]